MVAYIKKRSDFRTIASRLNLTGYEAAVAALDSQKSRFETAADLGADHTDNWLIADGHVWVINEVSKDGDMADIQCALPVEAFDRELSYSGTGAESIGDFIEEVMTAEYRDQADPVYAMPYLVIVNRDTTPFVEPEVDNDGLYTLTDYLYQVAKDKKVYTEFSVRGGGLQVEIFRKADVTHTIIFDHGTDQIEAQTFSRAEVAKVTIVQGETEQDWYLSADGKVSREVPGQRASGKWRRLILDEDEDREEAALKEFESGSASHKIEWRSNKSYALGDKLRMRLGSRRVTGEITYVGIQGNDDRTVYHSGELSTNLTDKLRGIM